MAEREHLGTRDETQNRIERAFLSLYETEEFDDISVVRLTSFVPCSRNTFYRYFHSIDKLLEHLEIVNTCSKICQLIIENTRDIPLEEAADRMAEFYEERKEAVVALCHGTFCDRYLKRQKDAMKPMFASLVSRAYDLTPMQLDYLSDYIACSKTSMIFIWVKRDCKMSLGQINKMYGSVIEKDLWSQVALQSPDYGGPKPRIAVERHKFDYPWESCISGIESASSDERDTR